MIASLPMYDRPETAAANDRFWSDIQERMGWEPVVLRRGGDPFDDWTSPDLVLSQTCGLPFRTRLVDQVAYLGTPDYRLPRCPPGHYNSVIVARADDARGTLAAFDGARMAFNSRDSQSGWAAPLNEGAKPGDLVETGAHRASATAVASGQADFAAIDAQTWRMIDRWDDTAMDLKIVTRTRPTPGLPLITGKTTDVAALNAAVSDAIAMLSRADRDTLSILSLVQIPRAAYLSIPTPSLI